MIDRKAIGKQALEEARRVLGDAIDYRRRHPYRFYLFHLKMERAFAREGKRLRQAWHRLWRRRYWAKAMASAEASTCQKAQAH